MDNCAKKFCRTLWDRASVVSLLLVGIGVATEAVAYIPPNSFILKTWVKKHKGVKKVKMRSTVVGFNKDKPSSTQFREILLFHATNGTYRSWATDMRGNKLYFYQGKISELPVVSRLFFDTETRDMIRALEDRGVAFHAQEGPAVQASASPAPSPVAAGPIQNQALVRWRKLNSENPTPSANSLEGALDSYAWVVGSQNPSIIPEKEVKEPQLWFEKDTFLPVRFLYHPTKDQEPYDFRFERYRFYREIPFPRSIIVASVHEKSERLFAVELNDLAVDSAISESAEDRGLTQNGFTAEGETAPSEVKDLIRQYYALFR